MIGTSPFIYNNNINKGKRGQDKGLTYNIAVHIVPIKTGKHAEKKVPWVGTLGNFIGTLLSHYGKMNDARQRVLQRFV